MALYQSETCPSWPSRREPDAGFTMTEVLVAMGVIFTTLLLMGVTMLSAFKSVGFSRQRTEATTLANQALEQIRALPADQLLLSRDDTATDPQLLPTGCLTTGTCTFLGRTVPAAKFGASPATTPLVPSHVTTTTASPGPTTYTITSYITIDPTDASGQTRIATIQVTWNQAQQNGVLPNVQVESKLHTSPFTSNAPGTHTYNATAQTTAGGISITGTMLNQTAVNLSLPFASTNAYFAGGTSGTSVGGGAAGSGQQVSAGTASGGLQALAFPLSTFPGATATQSSPAGSSAVGGPNPVSASPGVLTLNGSAGVGLGLVTGTLTGQVTAGGGSQADAVAASQANGQSSILSGTLPTNKLGYGSAEATQSGLISAALNLIGLLNIPIVQVTPTGNVTPDVSTVTQTGTGAAPSQAYTATATKSFTEVDVLPSLVIPVVKLTGFTSSASACASPTAALCSASTAIENGSLTILGVTTNLLGHVSGSLGLRTTTVALGLATLAIGVNATIGSSTATSPGSGTVSSPLTIDVTLQISTLLTGSLVNLAIHVDLGSVVTAANYS